MTDLDKQDRWSCNTLTPRDTARPPDPITPIHNTLDTTGAPMQDDTMRHCPHTRPPKRPDRPYVPSGGIYHQGPTDPLEDVVAHAARHTTYRGTTAWVEDPTGHRVAIVRAGEVEFTPPVDVTPAEIG